MIRELLEAGIRYERPAKRPGGRLDGKVFVFTGALSELKRGDAKKMAEALGGRVASGVSKKVDYVVVGEEPGSKLAEAKKLGIQTIDEATFKRMVTE